MSSGQQRANSRDSADFTHFQSTVLSIEAGYCIAMAWFYADAYGANLGNADVRVLLIHGHVDGCVVRQVVFHHHVNASGARHECVCEYEPSAYEYAGGRDAHSNAARHQQPGKNKWDR